VCVGVAIRLPKRDDEMPCWTSWGQCRRVFLFMRGVAAARLGALVFAPLAASFGRCGAGGAFGPFMAELGPGTPLNGSGPKNGAERAQQQPRRPILRPFRDHSRFLQVFRPVSAAAGGGLTEGGFGI